MSKIDKLFQDLHIAEKIQEKLPILFQLAEIDNQRGRKLAMEIGSARERIIIALLINPLHFLQNFKIPYFYRFSDDKNFKLASISFYKAI